MKKFNVYNSRKFRSIKEAINHGQLVVINEDDSARETMAKLNTLDAPNTHYTIVPPEEGGVDYKPDVIRDDQGIEIIQTEVMRIHPQDKKDVLDGSSAGYYDLPPNAVTLSDLIEYKKMDFNEGNIQKAIFRLNDKGYRLYNLNKIKYHNDRLISIELDKEIKDE